MADQEMGEAGPAGQLQPPATSAQGAMAELEQALGLAAAYFGGDEAVARWAAAADADAEPPLGAGLGGPWPTWKAEQDAAALRGEEAEQEALLGLLPAAGLDPGLLSSSPEEAEADILSGRGSALGDAGAGAGAAPGAPDAGGGAEAGGLERGVREMSLDDIDAEPGDTTAPGSGPLSLEAALVGQGGAAAQREPPPPPIVPAPTDVAAAEADPLAALEEAIAADKPKFNPSPEWLKMMEAVKGDLEEAASQGQPALVEVPTAAEQQAGAEDGPASSAQQAAPVPQPGSGPAAVAVAGAEATGPAAAAAAAGGPAQGQEEQMADAEAVTEGIGAAVAQLPAADEGGEAAATDADRERQRTFALLQPICSLLLQQRAEPQRMAELLTALAAALQDASQSGLEQCWDYVLFPLLMMLDAIAATRQAQGGGRDGPRHKAQQGGPAAEAGESAAAGALMALPAMASDRAAEAALACVLCMLRRCTCQSGDSLLGLLRRLASVLEIPQGAASEEALLCVGAAAAGAQRRPAPGVREALTSEAAAPLLGYLFSLLLQMAESEAQRGSSGSKAVRDAALQALLQLLSAIAGSGTAAGQQQQEQQRSGGHVTAGSVLPGEAQQAADALAFFLPGVAVGLCKALLLAASHGADGSGAKAPAGPAASSAAAVAALQSLVCLLVACLGDASVEPLLHGAASANGGAAAEGASGSSGWQDAEMADAAPAGQDTLQHALQQLHALAQQAKGGAASLPAAVEAACAPPAQQPQQHPQQPGRMRVDRSAEWAHDSAERLHQLLSTALPPLLAHQRASVRAALVQGCCRLLDDCSMALQPRTQESLLQLLLSAAQDEWQEVSGPAVSFLQKQAAAAAAAPGASAGGLAREAPAAAASFAATLERLLLQLVEGLPAALRSGDAAGRRHAQQLASAIQVSPPAWFAANVAQHPVRLQQLLAAFLEAFAFDASIAGMLLYAAAAPAGAATSYAAAQATAAAAGGAATDADAASPSTAADPQQQQVAAPGSGGAVTLLPRMPVGLALITTQKAYEAVAAALRAAAALAAAADAAPGSSGVALRCLVDGCLSRLRQLTEAAAAADSGATGSRRAHKRSKQQPGGGEGGGAQLQQGPPGPGQVPWQLQAASIGAVLGELLLGASPAWQPAWAGSSSGGEGTSGTTSSGSDVVSRELEALAAAAVTDLVQEAIWSLPTSLPAEGAAAGAAPATPLLLEAPPSAGGASTQQLGCNALLQKAAIECCGAAARALGPRFAQNGRLLRAALLPLLEKLADGTQLVSAAAQAAVGSICWWCGYGGSLRRLVAANADYVVDGMCRQLRQLEAHPRAPQLFTALLQQSGVAPELLPLLAEPARKAVQGLGILARRQQPQHVLAFLQALLPIASAAGGVARQALGEMRQVADAVQERWDARQRELEEQEQAAVAAAGGSAAATTQEEVRRFFLRQQRLRQRREQPGVAEAEGQLEEEEGGEGHPADDMELEEQERLVPMSGVEREQVALLRRHAHAAGSLAQAVADAASPLAMAQSLQVAVQSFGVVGEALRALAATTEAVELDTNKIQLLVRRDPANVAGPDPDTPRLLPSVHLAWAPLMGALQDWRVSVVEAALRFLSDLACLSGSFLRKRFAQEAAPALQRLLREGPARRSIIAPGQDDVTSPATVQRTQLAVLRCLQQLASCDRQLAIAGVSSSASEALLPAAQALLTAVGDAMGSRQPAPVREQATQAYIALARVDPDAAWCQLNAALHGTASPAPAAPGGGSSASDAGHPSSQAPTVPADMLLKSSGRPLAFPPLGQIAPPLPPPSAPPSAATAAGRRKAEAEAAGTALVVPPGLRDCGAPKLAAMLRQVEQLPPRWHKQVAALLER